MKYEFTLVINAAGFDGIDKIIQDAMRLGNGKCEIVDKKLDEDTNQYSVVYKTNAMWIIQEMTRILNAKLGVKTA